MNDLIISFPRSLLLSQLFNKLVISEANGKIRNYNRVAILSNVDDLKIFCGYDNFEKIKKNNTTRFNKVYNIDEGLINIYFTVSKKTKGFELLIGLKEEDALLLNKYAIKKQFDIINIDNGDIYGYESVNIIDLNISVDTKCMYIGYEGEISEKVIREKKRDPKLRKLKLKEFEDKNGEIYCECCGLNFENKYGAFGGQGFVEVHHENKMVSEMSDGDTTTLDDLAVVCCNCHEVIHRNKITASILKEYFISKRGKR